MGNGCYWLQYLIFAGEANYRPSDVDADSTNLTSQKCLLFFVVSEEEFGVPELRISPVGSQQAINPSNIALTSLPEIPQLSLPICSNDRDPSSEPGFPLQLLYNTPRYRRRASKRGLGSTRRKDLMNRKRCVVGLLQCKPRSFQKYLLCNTTPDPKQNGQPDS